MMVETDYENYAAYVECDEEKGYNFPVISSTTGTIDPVTLARYDKVKCTFHTAIITIATILNCFRLADLFTDLGANMDAFVRVRHDDNCQYN